MTAPHRRSVALWAAAIAALLLGCLAWLWWGDELRPHEPVRVITRPPGAPAQAEAASTPGLATSLGQPAGSSAAPPQAHPQADASALTGTPALATTTASAPLQDPLAAFRRAIEEAQARQAAQGGQAQTAQRYNSLPEAIEAARRAQQQASAPQPAPQPAPGAGLNPFGSR